MKRKLQFGMLMVMAAATLVAAQGRNAMAVLADVRNAIGGDAKVASVKTLSATGHTVKTNAQGVQPPTDVELAIELPDKFVKKDVVAVMGDDVIARSHGFNGPGLIESADNPASVTNDGASRSFVMLGPGMGNMIGQTATPEDAERSRQASLLSNRQEFARLLLGMLGTSSEGYPVTFGEVSQAAGPNGPAEVVAGTAADGFALKFYADMATHRPVMVTWMAKEPLRLTMTPGGQGTIAAGGSAGSTFSTGQSGQGAMSAAGRDQMLQNLQERMKAADANRRIVEYAVHYGTFTVVDGLTLPTTFEESIDGKSVETLTLDHIRVNPKIDPKRFDVTRK